MAFALFDFFKRNEIEVGRVSWIVSYFERDKFSNESWNKEQILQVGWPKNGAFSQLSAGSAVYPVKVLSISDDKDQLIRERKQMENEQGSEVSTENPKELGRGHRQKRRSRVMQYSSDDAIETEQASKKKKKRLTSKKKADSRYKNLMREVIENETNKEQPSVHVHDDLNIVHDLRQKIAELQAKMEQMESENRNLCRTIRLMKNLPELLDAVKKTTKDLNACRKLGDDFQTSNEEPGVEEHDDTTNVTTRPTPIQRLSSLVRRCNTHEPSKLVNDLLTGLYSNEYLAVHSLTGNSSGDNDNACKQRLEPTVVNEIVGIVMRHFPQKTPTEVKFYIRQKLNNAAKAIRKKQSLL